jgi:hypothetical protein
MLEFLEHPKFQKLAADLQRRFPGFNKGFIAAKRLFEAQFHPIDPKTVIVPGKLHCILRSDNYTVWKLEMAVEGLKSKQYPRVWFAVSGAKVLFLCAKTHVDNYDDGKETREALELVKDFF